MPEEQDVIYERQRGMKYIVVNGRTRKNEDTGLITTSQTLWASFQPIDHLNQMGIFNITQYVDNWLQTEISAGNVDAFDQKGIEKKRKDTITLLVKFIESHPDFRAKMIWKQKTREEHAAILKQHIADQQKLLEELEGIADELNIEEIKEIHDPDEIKSDGMVTGGGIISAGTIANKRGK
ncbi:MAG: hypothetical protein ACHQ6U_12175 [Thermodesulfobacteriota bacterium]